MKRTAQTPAPPPVVTIATVTYNAEKTLARTLKSVAGQFYPHIELLIIDGCSTDRTMELIHQYVDDNANREYPHDIRVIREPDKGLYDAMNKALNHAHGDYIVFLNAGDELHAPDTLKQTFGLMKATPGHMPGVVYGNTDIVDCNRNFICHRRLRPPKHLNWRSFCWGMLVCHQSFYVRTSLARQVPYNLNYRFSADYDWCVRVLKQAQAQNWPVLNSGCIMTDYLNEGLTTKNHKESLKERFRIMTTYYGWLPTLLLHGWFVLRAILKP
ncbi:MAG: glycosyltransferase [Paraprevotella sp.]|nr:glycosyltransferase [Paraprevotella sp.]